MIMNVEFLQDFQCCLEWGGQKPLTVKRGTIGNATLRRVKEVLVLDVAVPGIDGRPTFVEARPDQVREIP